MKNLLERNKIMDFTTNNKNSAIDKLASPTNYLIQVSLNNFKVNIYTGKQGGWKLIHQYTCTIGKPSTPTPRGTYSIGEKGPYFGVNKGYKCLYYTQFSGDYLFHSIVYNLDGSVRDGRLRMRLSNGCIRLATEHAKWIYHTIPKGTKVVIQ